jgi:beta-glucanase (GH16 family)
MKLTNLFTFLSVALMLSLCVPTDQAHAGWTQTFADEFNDNTKQPFDKTKWQVIDSFGVETLSGGGVQEAQCYKEAGSKVENGNLVFTATRQSFTACRNVPADKINQVQYQSGRVVSWNHFSQQYGYFEARIKMPPGAGMWPAFWLLENSGWPPEIDVMEWVGKDPAVAHFTIHFNDANGQHKGDGTGARLPNNASWADDWHTYGVDWTKDRVIWYADGVEKKRYTGPGISQKANYILLNLALGGGWGGPVDNTKIPATMLTDYVRVWQRNNDGTPDALPPTVQQPPVTPDPKPPEQPPTASGHLLYCTPTNTMIGLNANRTNPHNITVNDGSTLISGVTNVYIWADANKDTARVEFWLDRDITQPPTAIENAGPWDLAGTGNNGVSMPTPLSQLSAGRHTIITRTTLTDGFVQAPVTSTFTIVK